MAKEKRVNVAGQNHFAPQRKKPKLGQNFLSDPVRAQRIVETLGDLSTRTVVEIGPGRGALTDFLAPRAQRLIAIELDRVLAAQLRMRYARDRNVEIIEGDVLSTDLHNVVHRRPEPLLAGPPRKFSDPPPKASVVGNLPYYITSDILLHLLEFHDVIDVIVIMVQREVAERIAAKPGGRDYGLLSATAQLYGTVEKLFVLPPGAFSPPPQVHSMVLKLTIAPRFAELGVARDQFVDFLRTAFGQKRKTLFNNLRRSYKPADIRPALKAAGAREDVRAEALSLEKTAAVFRTLGPAVRPAVVAQV
ncbi:MAG: 16S rRNA (adenine(1518)-N(6)/adenine(1519)-N(6))-dimethyltransferase RsmA [Acidobacteriales bacterium]|nr:16S rRNA (adenine(1518)-N(6)/adenine(1519)-N(6))-dimethyltransferase RsmA [Terriglobales bacterium]